MNITSRFGSILLVAAGILLNTAIAQDTVQNVTSKGKLDSLQSSALHQKRYFEVFLPANAKPGEQFDVLYVLDGGNWNTGLINRTHAFIESEGYMPPTIVVSVMGIDRNNELTPTHLDTWKGSGGGKNFLSYIKDELIPHINKNYPSNNDNTIWGHSLGGMFVMYALLNEPATFKSYIAVDPSFWWDENYVPKMAEAKLPQLKETLTLFISGRQGSELSGMKIDTMEAVLKRAAPGNLNWTLNIYPEETHSSIRLKSIYDGLKFTYAGLTNDIQFHPMNGSIVKGKPAHLWYFEDTTRLNYTLDGSVPTLSSPKVMREITINGPATVTYKRFTNRPRHDKTIVGNFIDEKVALPVSKNKKLQNGGFNYAYYEGEWASWPDVKKLIPVKTGKTTKDFDVANLPRKKNYALLVDGFLEAKEDGYYMFLLDADKGSRLYIGDKLLIEWNGNYVKRTYSYLIPLNKGFYPIRLEYLHTNNQDFNLKLGYLTPSNFESKNVTPIPIEAQYTGK